jgi:hypothetical protein
MWVVHDDPPNPTWHYRNCFKDVDMAAVKSPLSSEIVYAKGDIRVIVTNTVYHKREGMKTDGIVCSSLATPSPLSYNPALAMRSNSRRTPQNLGQSAITRHYL